MRVLLVRTMASDLEVLILIQTASHTTANRPDACCRLQSHEVNRTTSSAKKCWRHQIGHFPPPATVWKAQTEVVTSDNPARTQYPLEAFDFLPRIQTQTHTLVREVLLVSTVPQSQIYQSNTRCTPTRPLGRHSCKSSSTKHIDLMVKLP